MRDYELYHHGILGQKWGVRRTQAQLARSGKGISDDSTNEKKKVSSSSSNSKKVTEMTDDELRNKISRLELEKRYKDLSKTEEAAKVSKGKAIAMDILEKSGKNIATQAVTYAMGTAVNKLAGSEVVNPKKGQKDK